MAEIFVALSGIGASLFGGGAAAGGAAGGSGLLGLLGTGLSAAGTIYAGSQAKAAANDQAKAMEQKGEQEVAIAQRKARESRREKQLVLSRQRAVAAASGGGVNDPTTESIMAKTEEKGEYNALLDMYNGATMRADLYREAGVARAEGQSQMTGSYINAAGTIYDGFMGQRRRSTEYATI